MFFRGRRGELCYMKSRGLERKGRGVHCVLRPVGLGCTLPLTFPLTFSLNRGEGLQGLSWNGGTGGLMYGVFCFGLGARGGRLRLVEDTPMVSHHGRRLGGYLNLLLGQFEESCPGLWN